MTDRDTSLLRDVGRLLVRSHDLGETLQNVVRLVARRMRAGGCSIYLLEGDDRTLVLRATRGLRPESVGRVRLGIGEGIVGASLEAGRPVGVPDVRRDPRSAPFPETGEERFRSLLAVPLMVRDQPIGVLTVQTARTHEFSADEVDLLETIAGHVAAIVLNARLLASASRGGPLPAAPMERRVEPLEPGTALRGLAISPGLAVGPVHIQAQPLDLDDLDYHPADSPRREWRAVERALRETVRQISDLRAAVGERLGEEFAEVFTTHIMILEDVGFREKLRSRVFDHGDGARSLVATMREYRAIFASTSDPVIRDRAADVEDVVRRAVAELLGVRQHNPPLRDGVIVVAERVLPGDFVLLETEKIAAIVTEHGGPTSHAAIFARSLAIPAVTGFSRLVERIRTSDRVVVDGIEGSIVLNPTPQQLELHGEKTRSFAAAHERLGELENEPATTIDGREVRLSANIGGLNDVDLVRRHGARGVGLFRTEILALFARGFPDEEEQVRIYERVAETVAPERVTVRTFDMGGDKGMPDEDLGERNPQLGWRSIRMLLDRPDVLDAQLRAIVRANGRGNLRVMLPMITSLEELDAGRAALERACQALGGAEPPPFGVMIETPAAVEIAESLARAVDFISIGTNDLVQYLLAVDRENERVAHLYDPLHPAVLRQLHRVAEATRAASVPCSVCGELAGNPSVVPVLIGMGIGELSMTPLSIPLVRPIVHRTDAKRAEELVRELLQCGRASEVRDLLARAYADMGILDEPALRPLLRRPVAGARVDSPWASQ